MNEFIEKWKTDNIFKTKIKLSVSTLFVVLVSIFAISTRNTMPTNDIYNQTNINEEEKIDNTNYETIQIPNNYKHNITIKINDNKYTYTRNKQNNQEAITKEVDGVIENYIYENNNFYKEDNEKYILTTEDEIYDIINYDYIKLETINQYLSKSIKEGNQYLVYLKDIILGDDSKEYIIIEINENKINIDYTTLMKNFDKSITSYLVNIEIEEIE